MQNNAKNIPLRVNLGEEVVHSGIYSGELGFNKQLHLKGGEC